MITLEILFKKLWEDYARINPQAEGIYRLLRSRQEKIINDHIAFRTFNIPKVGIDVLAKTFVEFGYAPKGEYHFPDKKLYAKHYEHPDRMNPKIFISELKLAEFSTEFQGIINNLVEQIPDQVIKRKDFCVAGVPWKTFPWEIYERLKKESEYAAWVAVFGFRANHFTVFFNSLKTFKTLEDLNDSIKASGYALNASGGEIKGSPREYLEQSSTLAQPFKVKFADGMNEIPACYYEFARRYPLPNGELFSGFVAQSADKIFESTDNKPTP